MTINGYALICQINESVNHIPDIPHCDTKVGKPNPLVFLWIEVFIHQFGVSASYIVADGSRVCGVCKSVPVLVNVVEGLQLGELVSKKCILLSQHTLWDMYTCPQKIFL